MPDELGLSADPRTIDDLLGEMLVAEAAPINKIADFPRHTGPEYERNYLDLQKAMKPRIGNAGRYSPLPGYSEESYAFPPLQTPYKQFERGEIEKWINRRTPGRVPDPDVHENYYSSSIKKDI